MSLTVEELYETKDIDKGPGEMRATRNFLVEGTDDTDEALLAFGIPQEGAQWGWHNPFLIAQFYSTERRGPLQIKIAVGYEYPKARLGTMHFGAQAKLHLNMGTASQRIYKDLDGKPIGDPLDRLGQFGVNVPVPTLELVVEMPVPWSRDFQMYKQKAMCVNGHVFFGLEEGCCQYQGTQATHIPQYGDNQYKLVHRFKVGEYKVEGEIRGLEYIPKWTWIEVEVHPEGEEPYKVRVPDQLRWFRMFPRTSFLPLIGE